MDIDLVDLRDIIGKVLTSCSLRPYLYRLNRSKLGSFCTKFALASIRGAAYDEYLEELKVEYLGDGETVQGQLNEIERVFKYDGSDMDYSITFINVRDPIVADVWNAFDNANVSGEKEWLSRYKEVKSAKGFSLEGDFSGRRIVLIMSAASVRELQNCWSLVEGKFKVCKERAIFLPSRIDIVRIDDTAYYLTKSGLGLTMSIQEIDRANEKTIQYIVSKNVLTDPGLFSEHASHGVNARRLMRFKKKKLDLISKKGKMADNLRDTFGVKFDGEKIVITTKEDVGRVVKLTCDRGMVDPFSKEPNEVSGAFSWK